MARAIKKAFAKIRMVNLDSLVWDDEEYEIEAFLEKFSLPQIVMVREGQYERTDEKTISAGQVLKLHTVQQSEKVFGETSKGDEICIPLRCPHKLEIVPNHCNKVEYETLEELFNLSPKYIRALDTLERPQIKKGTIFEIKGKTLLSSIWYVELKNTAKPYNRVQIPLSMKARFQPLVDLSSYFLVEVLKLYSFPFQVRFLKNTEAVDRCQDDFVTEENNLDLPSLGLITLQDRNKESTVISTSRNGRTVTVVTFPTDLSILFSPALGLIKGDSTYARICRDFHDGVDLEKIKNRGQQKAYLSKDAVQQVNLDYEEIPPVVPPRDNLPQAEVDEYSDNSDSNEWSDSEEEDPQTDSPAKDLINSGQIQSCLDATNNNANKLPPPRPPKPLKATPISSTTTNPQLGLKKPPLIKPKPSIKLAENKYSAAQIGNKIATIKQKMNIENQYNRAYAPNSPACSQDKTATVCEDSAAQIGGKIATIKEKMNIEGPYNRAYEQNSPTCSRDTNATVCEDSAAQIGSKIASIKQKMNMEVPYNRAYEPNSPTCSRDTTTTVCEDSGIGMESLDGVPIPPMRISSLQHEQEGKEDQQEQSLGSLEEEGAIWDHDENSSNSNEYIYPSSGSSGEHAEGKKHDYIYIDAEEEGVSRPKAPTSPTTTTISRLRQMWPRFPGLRRHSNALTSLEDLRRVVEEDRIESLTMNQVSDCLKLLNLSDYRKEFKKKQVDGSLFASLTKQHLVDLGVHNVTDRTKILKLVNEGWVPKL